MKLQVLLIAACGLDIAGLSYTLAHLICWINILALRQGFWLRFRLS